MPESKNIFEYASFLLLFDGLIPEGIQLEVILKRHKIDKQD
ncbi:MAG: hypothetical protein JKX98_04330 [Alcanivoracaceae bacterium]|nr:hypothetical protein [Alcanivoracaceae bacterium]